EIFEVLRDRKSFVQGGYSASGNDLMHGTVLLLDGREHLERRRLLGKLMTEDAISGYRHEILHPAINHTFEETARTQRDADGVVRTDLVQLAQLCLYRIAGAATGIDGLEQPEDALRFIKYIKAMAHGVGADWAIGDTPAEVTAAAMDALARYKEEFFVPSMVRRKAMIEAGEEMPNDLISVMYSNWDDSWDEDLPLRESAVFMVAATQTTAASTVLLILRMDEWLKGHPEDRIAIFEDPAYLRHATYESLRRTVAQPARIRRAIQDVELSSGRKISAGERVALLFLPANTDPELFGADAERFNPRRGQHSKPEWGLAFSGGSHACIGRPMATGNVKAETDGSVTALARRLYDAGVELVGEPVRDQTTHYPVYDSVPVVLRNL
ncbi:cytochrome P450, partial [Mycobacterium sp. NAZ190054]|uniref:cytochrome P450 n=1 Tax=Mycobacterium sp. NAZ190054 TaxID=1747766 RepID=UPI0007940B9E